MKEHLAKASMPSGKAASESRPPKDSKPDDTTVIGPTGEAIVVARLVLGIEKFLRPRCYRLIWIQSATVAWKCQEDPTEYRRKRDAVEAGQTLARQLGAARFSEVTR